jgi:SAM-dependent methyltransferase
MGHEASKTKQIMNDYERSLLTGDGIDIGCGLDPIMPSAKPFDMEDGDANIISQFVSKQFDYVFSSHCLEHMHDPKTAILEWWKLVKKDGYLIFTVPDEDLYELGYFPSLFNDDHKSTFTISKRESWSDRSHNLLELVTSLPESELIKIEVQDTDYDKSIQFHSVYSRDTAYNLINFVRKFSSIFQALGIRDFVASSLSKLFRLPIDQSHNDALAQIFVIVKKV